MRRRRRRRREGRAVRGAVEGLRGAAVQRAATRGEGLLLPAGPHRAGEAAADTEGGFVVPVDVAAASPRFQKGFLGYRIRVCARVGIFARISRGRSGFRGLGGVYLIRARRGPGFQILVVRSLGSWFWFL
jgi:hypothetical protein